MRHPPEQSAEAGTPVLGSIQCLSPMSFVHLHTHSHFSLLDGLGSVTALVAEAKRLKMPALALTDHGVMYGAVDFYKECTAAGIKPIIGVEGYLTDGSLAAHDRAIKPYHLILLAQNSRGYHNLLKLTAKAHLEGFYYKPRFDWETLAEHAEGLIALTACLNGPLARPILARDEKQTIGNIKQLISIFGSERLYLEMQNRPSIPDQSRVNEALKRLSKEFGVGLVATNDVHYVKSDDAAAHDVLICLQTKAKLTDTKRMSYLGEDFSLLSSEEMKEAFKDTPQAIENTLAIADTCTVELELNKINLPSFPLPAGKKSNDDYLSELAFAGIEKRYGVSASSVAPTVIDRLNYELDVIHKTGFSDYFLIVQDFVNWAKMNGIMVGPGRGSAAGSLVSYLTGITNIDPLAYNLLFERFLNPERISMPDIDMDFSDTERDRVLHYVEEKYGKDRVAQIITFGTMAARAAVRDVGRVMNLSYSFCDRIAKLIPPFTGLADALEKVAELKDTYEKDDDARRLLTMAKKLEGVARHTSTHACAVIITRDPLVNHVPLQYSSSDPDAIISQYSMYPVESLGLLKMDFLGLTNLTTLQTAVEIIRKTTDITIDLENLPLQDPETFRLLQRGETVGIFQMESDGMTRYLKKLKPSAIEDIIAMVALYRPGPMQFIEDFIAGKHGKGTVAYLHPKLAPILDKTYGIAVYQEQVLQIARDLAGFSYGEADLLRKAVGKKIKKLLDEQSEKMIAGMVRNGIAAPTAQKIWDFILPFARYGFNRSHAASYALIAYQTAYLKAHFPAQFMAALMTADQGSTDRIAKEVRECRRMGLVVQPPDVNESFTTFSVVMDPETKKISSNLRFGLSAVKNVGDHISKEIIHERKNNGPYASMEDFLTRITDKDLNKKSLESLIKCGALDSFGDRATLLGNMENIIAYHKKIQSHATSKQDNLFADLPLAKRYMTLKLDPVTPLPTLEKLRYEKELLGLYVSDHPFERYRGSVPGTVAVREITRGEKTGDVKLAGIITAIKKILTKDGKPMMFATLEDGSDSVELVVFPKLIEAKPAVWQENTIVVIRGSISDKDGVSKIRVDGADAVNEDQLAQWRGARETNHKLWITVPASFTKENMNSMRAVLEKHPGTVAVYLRIHNGTERKIKTNLKVANSPDLLAGLERLVDKSHISIVTGGGA